MACATLKRSCEWDPLQSPSTGGTPKRRRCSSSLISPVTKINRPTHDNPSPFGEVSSKFTSEQIAANIKEEIRKLQRRKQLRFDGPGSSLTIDGASSPPHPGTSSGNTTGLFAPSCRDQPLFSFRQVNLICERMIKDRENQIRDEYDRILTTKLAEQYDTFVKFTYDQIQKRFENCTPSYLS